MSIHNLNQDILTNVFSYLDRYDANNLRMANKFFHEEVNAIQIYQPFHTPVYQEDKHGFSIIKTASWKYKSFGPQESLTWCEHRGALSRRNNSYRYIIYTTDEFGGYPHFFKELSEVLSIMNSYYTFREGIKIQKEFLEKKAKKEAIVKKNTFVIKGSGKPTNPWKKV
jgi:hypothetical protein